MSAGQIDLHSEAQRDRLLEDGEGQGGKGLFFCHPLAIIPEAVHIPVAGGGQVEFPVAGGVLRGEEKLQAGLVPEPVQAAGVGGRPGQRQGRKLSPELIAQRQGVGPGG